MSGVDRLFWLQEALITYFDALQNGVRNEWTSTGYLFICLIHTFLFRCVK